MPMDVKIYNTLNENEEWLLEIEGVGVAGIARNESDNHIIGIAVYVEDNVTNAQKIPSELGHFEVFVKKL
ncbi:MAG: hypothetical protein OEW62_08550 [Candidatus Bathyarchaeota archaeon]|nr:hypothetical protein [Candidatus Bathyarchaeota archaeon]